MSLRGDLHGAPWTSMEASTELHGGPWRPVEVFMEVRGNLHGGLQRSMEVRGGPHGDLHGAPRASAVEVSIKLHGGPRRSPWRSMEVRGGLHGGPWSLHGPRRSLHVGLNYVSKKYIFSYCSSINKEYLIHQYSFKLKWFNCLYLPFFKGFHGFHFIFAHSNLDILFKICPGRCYFILAPTNYFGYAQKAHLSKCSARVPRQNSRLEKCMHAFLINANLPCAIKLTDCIWSQYLFVRSVKSTIQNSNTQE